MIHDLVNKTSCSSGGFNGTSNDFCQLDINRIERLWRFPLNYKFAPNFDFTLANLVELQQEGVLTPIYTFVNTNFTTEDNGVETFGGGRKKLIEKMPVQIEGKLINGFQGYKNTLTVEKSRTHSFLVIDKDGNIFGAKGKDGLFGGLNSEFLQVKPYMGSGDASGCYMVELQLDRFQFDTGLAVIANEEYDFDFTEVKGVNNVDIEFAVPVDGATSITLNIFKSEDKTPVGGFATANLNVFVNGAVVVATVVNNVATLPALATGDLVKVETADGALKVADLGGLLYRGASKEVIVIA